MSLLRLIQHPLNMKTVKASPMISDAITTKNEPKPDKSSGERSAASGSNLGRRGDPRMHKAVASRVKNPSISLLEALVEGGFQFPDYCEGSGKSDRDIFDIDGVQLCQRKNQLSRRLRLMRKRGEAEAAAARSNQSVGNAAPGPGMPGEEGNTLNSFSTDPILASQALGVGMTPQLMNLMLLQQRQQQQQSVHQEPDLSQMAGVDSSMLLANAMQQQQQLRGKRPLDSDSLTEQQSINGGMAPQQRLVQNLQIPSNNFVGLDNAGNATAMQAAMFASGPVSTNFIPYASFISQNNFSQSGVNFQVPMQGHDKQPTVDLNRFLGMPSAASMGLGGEQQQQMQALMKNGFQGLSEAKASEADSNTNLNNTGNAFTVPSSQINLDNGKTPIMMEVKETTNVSTHSNNSVKLSLAINLFRTERQDLIEKCLSKVGLDPHDSSIIQDFELKLSSTSEHHLEL